MLKDANPRSFAAIYIVCGRTDMRYGIDSLSAIIESRYHLPLFVPGTLFLFCGMWANKIKGLVWEGYGFLLFTKRIESGHFMLPRHSVEAKRLSPKQFEWIISPTLLHIFLIIHCHYAECLYASKWRIYCVYAMLISSVIEV